MQILIYKTDLRVERAPAWLTPTAPVRLYLEDNGAVSAYAVRPSSLFGLRPGGPVRIGALSSKAGNLLVPALRTNAPLRVRAVELVPPHLTIDGQARVAVSVWGDLKRLRLAPNDRMDARAE
jgi:hypothetical protein